MPNWQRFPLDGKLLLFDRETGLNRLIDGGPAATCRQQAPRVLQVSLTNRCNKRCGFCYRPLAATSAWTFEEMLQLGRVAADWGVLELAFGGGEPTVFPRFGELLRRLWEETSICPNFTTNGLLLTPAFLEEIKGAYGQIQLSVYDEDDTFGIIDTLVRANARFGLNYLVTPARLETLETDLLRFLAAGVRDVLLLSYKGSDPALHLSSGELATLDETIARLYEPLRSRMALKVDVCWGSRLSLTPRLFETGNCGAGQLFCSISSDRRMLACSFGDEHFDQDEGAAGLPIDDLREMPALWKTLRGAAPAADAPGCARLHGFGLGLLPATSLLRVRGRAD
ncbi:MAG: radical SAM protein [Myxococcota bacterium]